jgi:hypothetical protein
MQEKKTVLAYYFCWRVCFIGHINSPARRTSRNGHIVPLESPFPRFVAVYANSGSFALL